MVPCLTNWPGFYWDVPHKGINTHARNGVEKILQSPGEPRTSELYRGFSVDLEKLDTELWLRRLGRCDVFDEKVDSVEFEGVGQWLWVGLPSKHIYIRFHENDRT
jgi:hypothetical protein